MNIIADIAGQYDALLALLKKMPDDEVVSVGDMIDRGPQSRHVVEWFMKNGKAIFGNHEHMMLDYFRKTNYYKPGVWQYNGGNPTLISFGGHASEEVLNWMENLPKYMEVEGCLVSHSFWYFGYDTLEQACDIGTTWDSEKCDNSIIWNRMDPIRRPQYKMQIAGHNSQMGLQRFSDEQGEFAICLDDCRKRVLTGLHLPSFQIFQQEF